MGKVNPLITYLRRSMIYEKPSTDELKRMLDEKIAEIKSHEDRVLLLTEILKLRDSRDFDSNYKGGFMDFFNYAEYKLEDMKITTEIRKDWSSLFNELVGKYIKDTSLNDFNEVMNHHRLPNGKEKIRWFTKKSDAVKFLDWFKFEFKEFNQCFISKNGKVVTTHNRTITDSDPQFKKILERY